MTRLYQVFLHRDSRPDEQRYWVSRFRQTGSADRIGFVREFCQANNIVYLASTPTASRVAFRPAGAPTAITEALAAKAALLGDMIRNELGGSRFGQELMLKAPVLNSASTQYRDTLNSPRSTPQQVAIAAGNVGRALQDLEVVFRSVPGASANCQNMLWEVGQLVAATGPTAGIVLSPSVARTAVEREAEQLLGVLWQFAAVLFPYQQQGPFYTDCAPRRRRGTQSGLGAWAGLGDPDRRSNQMSM